MVEITGVSRVGLSRRVLGNESQGLQGNLGFYSKQGLTKGRGLEGQMRSIGPALEELLTG